MTYQLQSFDTTIAAELALFSLWRSWSLLQRATRLNAITRSARATTWQIAKITLAHQDIGEQVHYFLLKVLYNIPAGFPKLQGEIHLEGAIDEALLVAAILESLDSPYLVGGSVASSIWGEMRYTQDIDLVVHISPDKVEPLLQAFSPQFYISEDAVRQALQLGGSFNLIDLQTGWKIDIFVLTQDNFKQSEFQRRKSVTIDETGRTLMFATPEDTILQKLRWYCMTNRQSDKQWRDILGVFKLQNQSLDLSYLQQWAQYLAVSEDLVRAMTESGLA